jgi:hypothetical protein
MSEILVIANVEPSGRATLSDGSLWRIVPNQVITAAAWRGNPVTVRRDDSAVWNYRLTNLETRGSVNMLPEEAPQPRMAPAEYGRAWPSATMRA